MKLGVLLQELVKQVEVWVHVVARVLAQVPQARVQAPEAVHTFHAEEAKIRYNEL